MTIFAAPDRRSADAAALDAGPGAATPLVRIRDLVKDFDVAGSRRPARAVAGVSLDIAAGEVYALVGESGSGKTTLARCLLRLVEATSGSIEVGGVDVRAARGDGLRQLRRQMQVVFQNPTGSLDPRMRVRDLVAEPIRAHLHPTREELDRTVTELLDQVGLGRIHLERRPHELSGGQCQRVAIARALGLRPRLLVLDEPTSALDVSVQAQILNLLLELRREHDLTFLLISHDLGVVRHLSDRVGVMYLARIVEQGPARTIFERAEHPYTRSLLASMPDIEGGATAPILLRGDPPTPTSPPSGCRFHPRCWLRERLGNPEACETTEPPAIGAGRPDGAACHFADRTTELMPLAAEPAAGFVHPSGEAGTLLPRAKLTVANWQDPPFNRRGYVEVAALLPTDRIGRGTGPVTDLPRDDLDLVSLSFDFGGSRRTVAGMLSDTQMDGFLVLHRGRLVTERYGGVTTDATPHLLQSVSKSMTATVAGILVGEGRLDPDAEVGTYVEELRGGSFTGCTVQHLLDMRAGTRFSEAYEDPASDIRISEQVSGWRPREAPDLPRDLYRYMTGLSNARPHGGPFDYRSILSDVLGWVVARAGGGSFAEVASRGLWSKLGAEQDATITVDHAGCPVTDGGFSVTLRDLGRFGLMHLQDGAIGGRQVVPATWIERLRRPNVELAAAFRDALEVPGLTGPRSMYHDQWWVLDPAAGIYVAIGIHGQIVFVHRPSETVVVKLSTQPKPVDRDVFRYQLAGAMAICRELQAERR
jgi:oligopeptide/dipeptide ABC transporter ATP-binding protein